VRSGARRFIDRADHLVVWADHLVGRETTSALELAAALGYSTSGRLRFVDPGSVGQWSLQATDRCHPGRDRGGARYTSSCDCNSPKANRADRVFLNGAAEEMRNADGGAKFGR
jgi:hypothetical protein